MRWLSLNLIRDLEPPLAPPLKGGDFTIKELQVKFLLFT
jgi:hypothetical protein